MTVPRSAFALFLCVVLSACGVDTTGLSETSAKPVLGPDTSSVTVTEYADFQCPACASAYTLINKPLEEKYAANVRFAFKHFPLRAIHPYAYEAALASECAADQGKFWEFVELNYANQKDLSSEALRSWGTALGLDADLYDRCIRSEIKGDAVMSDAEEGEVMDVQGTPSYFVNGQRVQSSLEAISAAIDQELAKAESAPL